MCFLACLLPFGFVATIADHNSGLPASPLLAAGRTIPCDSNHFAYTLHEPIGVVGQIIPW